MTGEELTAARKALGLTPTQLASLLRVSGYRTVHKWESDARAIPGTVEVLISALVESQAVRRYFGVAIGADAIDRCE